MQTSQQTSPAASKPVKSVVKRDGSVEPLSKKKLARCVERACEGLEGVSAATVVDEAYAQVFDGVRTTDIHQSAVLAAAARAISEPNYSYAAARLLMHGLYREAFGHSVNAKTFKRDYREAFKANVRLLVEIGRFNPKMAGSFDLDALAAALDPGRDLLLKYAGVATLHDRYVNHVDGRRLETPQAFFMRVAMGLCVNEDDPTSRALDIYELISTLRYSPATPTLLNSGKAAAQMSSCYVMTMEDSIDGIYGTLHKAARLSKYGGGLGIDATPLRGPNAHIHGTNGKSNGLVNWAKQFNGMVHAVNQGGSRKGAGCLYLEPWHADFLDFLELRKGTGDERRRCHDIDTASWVPDELMARVRDGAAWYFFCPSECPRLHETYGEEFSREYAACVERAESGLLRNWSKMDARDLWKKMLRALKETGHPWVLFKDGFNHAYMNKHAGIIRSSQLCTEIGEHTIPTTYKSDGEVDELGELAVCNLASVNVGAYFLECPPGGTDAGIDYAALARDIAVVMRGLDNVIDENFYPVPEAKLSNQRYRFVGLGVMGWADLLQKLGLPFDSEAAVDLADYLQEFISYHAIDASVELARERGPYPMYAGSEWSKGRLPLDMYREVMAHRPPENCHTRSSLDWGPLREKLARHGIRNALTQAPAPTATIGTIVGCSEGVGPAVRPLYIYQTISGNFAVFSDSFVRTLKGRGLWTAELVAALRKVDFDVRQVDLPPDIQEVYKTAWDIDQKQLLKAAARRQKWIDQSQSVNVYYKGTSMRELSDLYFYAWDMGLKSTYYLHGFAASAISKTSVADAPEDDGPEGDNPEDAPESHDNPEADPDGDALPASSCSLNGPCESCQ